MKGGFGMDQMKIGSFLKELRKEKGMTQEQLAEQLNTSNRSVSRWETERLDIFNCSANCSCVIPFSFLSSFKKEPIFIWSISNSPFITRISCDPAF